MFQRWITASEPTKTNYIAEFTVFKRLSRDSIVEAVDQREFGVSPTRRCLEGTTAQLGAVIGQKWFRSPPVNI